MYIIPTCTQTGHSKIKKIVGFPPSVKDFFCKITCTFKRPRFQLFRFKIAQCVPFWFKNPRNLSKISKKGTNREILNLNTGDSGKVQVI